MELLQSSYLVPLAAAGGAILFLSVLFILSARGRKSSFELQRRSRLLSSAERGFFDRLMPALSEDFYIFKKVAMLDVVSPSPAAGYFERRRIVKRLGGQFLDYVLCKKGDLAIFGVIELENFDKGASRRERKRRERLIDGLCKAAQFRSFYFDIRQDYQHVDIRRLVTGYSPEPKKPQKEKLKVPEVRLENPMQPEICGESRSQFTVVNSSYAAFAKRRTCPQCNGEVVTKVAVKGKRIGEKFLMCRKYPYCDYRVAVNDSLVAKEVQTFQAKRSQPARPGFKDWSAG